MIISPEIMGIFFKGVEIVISVSSIFSDTPCLSANSFTSFTLVRSSIDSRLVSVFIK